MDKLSRVIRAAGILEGEGSFLTKTGGNAYRVSCQMTDEDVILELKDLFGGAIHIPKQRKDHYKPVWVWTVYGEKARECMDAVRPYMFSRRGETIDKVISTWEESLSKKQLQKDRADQAAKSWLAGEGSLRELSNKYGVGYETIRIHASNLA